MDDEALELDILSQALRLAFPEYRVLTAENGRVALEVIEAESVDLLITDLCMPEVDGFDVLLKARELFPNLPTIAMSGFGFAHAGELARAFGTRLFLEKPLDFDTLCHAIRSVLASPTTLESVVRGFNLASFLQLMELDCKTGNLDIFSPGHHGTMCFESGRLIHAITECLHGEEAVFEIMSWQDPEIRISNFTTTPASNIETSLSTLLLHGCKAIDEKDDAQQPAQSGGAPSAAPEEKAAQETQQPTGVGI